jgi:hypothetical protein
MKLTKQALKRIIKEEIDEALGAEKEPVEKVKVRSISDIATSAGLSEDATMVLGQLKDILKEWEQAKYESDEQRWQAYAEDIQRLVGKHEGEVPAEEEVPWQAPNLPLDAWGQ